MKAGRRFILSTGRTGTVAIARDINRRAGNATALHEPRPRTPLRILGGLAMERRVPKWLMRAVWEAVHIINSSHKARLIVEINVARLGLAPYVAQIDPDARFLHIVRNPADYIQSGVNFGATRMKRFVNWTVPGWEPGAVRREAQARIGRVGVNGAVSSEAIRLAVRWKLVNEFYGALGASLGARYKLVQFEDIFQGRIANYEEAISWLGVEISGQPDTSLERYNPSCRKCLQGYDDIPATVRDEIREICGEAAYRFGYPFAFDDVVG